LKQVKTPVSVNFTNTNSKDRPSVLQKHTEAKKQTNVNSFKATSKIKFLIVEDDKTNRAVIENFLKHSRIDLTIAENGLLGVEAFKAGGFDIIFMDVSMPVMDGITATQEIRDYEAAEGMHRTPIICLSAHVMQSDRERFLNAGMDDYLSKPLDRKRLLRVTSKWLKTGRALKSAKRGEQAYSLPLSSQKLKLVG